MDVTNPYRSIGFGDIHGPKRLSREQVRLLHSATRRRHAERARGRAADAGRPAHRRATHLWRACAHHERVKRRHDGTRHASTHRRNAGPKDIYTDTSPAGVRGSNFRWFFDPRTPARLVLVFILGSHRTEHN